MLLVNWWLTDECPEPAISGEGVRRTVCEGKGVGRTNQNEHHRGKQSDGAIWRGKTSGRDVGGRRRSQLDTAEMDNAMDPTRQLAGLIWMLGCIPVPVCSVAARRGRSNHAAWHGTPRDRAQREARGDRSRKQGPEHAVNLAV